LPRLIKIAKAHHLLWEIDDHNAVQAGTFPSFLLYRACASLHDLQAAVVLIYAFLYCIVPLYGANLSPVAYIFSTNIELVSAVETGSGFQFRKRRAETNSPSQLYIFLSRKGENKKYWGNIVSSADR
jgi:hypothetical protein